MGMLSLAIVATTAALNASLPVVNAYGLPHVEAAVTRILDREVRTAQGREGEEEGEAGAPPPQVDSTVTSHPHRHRRFVLALSGG